MNCILCGSGKTRQLTQKGDLREFYQCDVCDFLFLDPKLRLDASEEKYRYEQHNNDITDLGYQKFVSPLVDLICKNIPSDGSGLDFGSGTGPVLSHLLEQKGFCVSQYDVYFSSDSSLLHKKYDFIVSCEVVEHLYDPQFEFIRLSGLLRPGGILGVMTLLWQGEDVFNWYYSRDPTHVGFFSEKNLEWLRQKCGFSHMQIAGPRLVYFIK